MEINPGKKTALVIDQKDNVCTVLADVKAGETCTVMKDNGSQCEVTVIDDVPFGHKVALVELEKDTAVLKYGEEIGKMKQTAKQGSWIHTHNLYCDRGLK